MSNPHLVNEIKLLCKTLELNFNDFVARAQTSPERPDILLYGMLQLLKAGFTKDEIIGLSDVWLISAGDKEMRDILVAKYHPPLAAEQAAKILDKITSLEKNER